MKGQLTDIRISPTLVADEFRIKNKRSINQVIRNNQKEILSLKNKA